MKKERRKNKIRKKIKKREKSVREKVLMVLREKEKSRAVCYNQQQSIYRLHRAQFVAVIPFISLSLYHVSTLNKA
jgi:hypothetical protein